MKARKVYNSGGELLGDEFVDLSKLQLDTKKAIMQLIYLDETVDIYNYAFIGKVET